MAETLLTAAVTLLVGFGSAWLAIGNRERRVRATLKDEFDLLSRLQADSRFAPQLSAIIDKRLRWYVRRPERVRRQKRYALAFMAVLLALLPSLILGGGLPHFASLTDGLWRGAVLGSAMVLVTYLIVQVNDDDSALSRRFRVISRRDRSTHTES